MVQIENDIEHDAICQRVEELLLMTDDDTPLTDPKLIELISFNKKNWNQRIGKVTEKLIDFAIEYYGEEISSVC